MTQQFKYVKNLFSFLVLIGLLGAGGCSTTEKKSTNQITVGVMAGPETELMRTAKERAQSCYGLDIKIVTFTDYHIPNAALQDRSLDANVFQHRPFLDAFKKAHYYTLVAVGKTFIYPMGIYSKSIKKIADLPNGSRVAIPNDPSNEARALLLLQRAQLITLKPGSDIFAMPRDILSNPKGLRFIALDAAQLPRILDEIPVAVINTNFAIPAGLRPHDALLAEDRTSLYANLIVVREEDLERTAVKQLVLALHSAAVVAEAKRLFGDSAIPAWDPREKQLPCEVKPLQLPRRQNAE